MLLSAVHAFAAFHAIDSLPVAAAVAGVSFAWAWYFVAPDAGLYWAIWPAGLVLAALLRALTRRLPAVRLWPDSVATPRQVCAPLFITLAFTWYSLFVEDPASSLVAPFPIGAVLALLYTSLALLVIEIADHIGGNGAVFMASGVNFVTWCGVAGLVALDLLVWLHGWLLVVLGVSALGTAALVFGAAPALFPYVHTKAF